MVALRTEHCVRTGPAVHFFLIFPSPCLSPLVVVVVLPHFCLCLWMCSAGLASRSVPDSLPKPPAHLQRIHQSNQRHTTRQTLSTGSSSKPPQGHHTAVVVRKHCRSWVCSFDIFFLPHLLTLVFVFYQIQSNPSACHSSNIHHVQPASPFSHVLFCSQFWTGTWFPPCWNSVYSPLGLVGDGWLLCSLAHTRGRVTTACLPLRK